MIYDFLPEFTMAIILIIH